MTDLRSRSDRDFARRPLEWNPPRQAISRVPYLPGLDGLRCLAVVAVMLYHTNQGWLRGGFIGVEVFFVISGYLITLLLIAEHEKTGQVDLLEFWKRRARRLLPALFFMLALLVIYVALFKDRELGKLRGDVIGGLTYITNWYQIWVGQGYTAGADFAPLRHLWSLAVEEQFYLVWPLVMIGLLRLGRRRLPRTSLWLAGIAVGIAIVVALMFHSGPVTTPEQSPGGFFSVGDRQISTNDALYLSTISRATGLLLGSAFAMLWRPVAMMRGPMRDKARQLDAVALLGLAGLAGLSVWLYVADETAAFDPWLFRGGFLLVAVATIATIPAVTHRQSLVAKLLANPVFNWIGTRSYGLYLFHWPIYQILREQAGAELTGRDFVIAMVATVALTEFSYRYVEMPIRRRQLRKLWNRLGDNGDQRPRQLVVLGGGLAALALAFSSVSMVRADLRQNELAEQLDDNKDSTNSIDDVLGGTVPVGTDAPVASSAAPSPGTEAGAAPVPTVAATDPPVATTLANPVDVGPRFAIGDSVMLGAASSLKEQGFFVDAAESRQFASYIPKLEAAVNAGALDNTEEVLVHLGTNGTVTAEQADQLFGLLEGVPRVLVFTVAGNQSWIAGNNDVIIAAAAKYPNIEVGYFAQLYDLCGADCFADTNLHMNAKGAKFYADTVDYWFGTEF